MAAVQSQARSHASGVLAAMAAAVLSNGTACEGTKHVIFEPLAQQAKVSSPKLPMTDAGSVPPPADAGQPIMHEDPAEDDAGSEPDSELDPKITFVWTETLPGQGTCRAGVYAGSFDCNLTDPLTGLPLSLSGEIAFTLDGSSEQQLLTISDGSISGAWVLSGITGSLDCIQNHFQATAVDGHSVSIGDPSNPIVDSPFNASLQGDYDKELLVISGTLTMVNADGDMCTGMFRVSAAP